MKYIPQSYQDQRELLSAIGLKSTDDLFNYIPPGLRMPRKFGYPRAQSESEIRSTFRAITESSRSPSASFAGGGIYQHEIPSIVPFLQGRSEFATAYTPYQPEITQGLLQCIFEFQTLMCQLTETELSNASVYDGATALAEAVLMGLRLKKKSSGKILISEGLHPHYQQVLKTYLTDFSDRIEALPLDGDRLNAASVSSRIEKGDVDLLVTMSPNFFGCVEAYPEFGAAIQRSEALWITSTPDPFVWGILRGPGAFGAHIVTAEGQSFGNGPYLGGASFGIFCTKNEYLRNLPGRLVGETVDTKGRRSYTLTFATREQFIRRDKATSNICTNQNLNMLAGLIHLSTLGKSGVKEVAEHNLSLCEYVKAEIKKFAPRAVSASPSFNEFVVEAGTTAKSLVTAASAEGWVCGIDLGRFKESWKNKLLIHVSEIHSQAQIEKLLGFLKKHLG